MPNTETNAEIIIVRPNNTSEITTTDLTQLELTQLRSGAKNFVDPRTKQTHLVGTINKNDLLSGKYKEWFDREYKNYAPNPNIVAQLTQKLDGKSIEIFLATWCGDTRRELPRFLKILDAAGFPANKINLIALNREKETPNNLQAGKNIARVPTFIVQHNNQEIGRIIEKPAPGKSLEAELLAIVG